MFLYMGKADTFGGQDQPCDPLRPEAKKNTPISSVSIKDIAPAVAKLLDVPAAKEWEGTPRV